MDFAFFSENPFYQEFKNRNTPFTQPLRESGVPPNVFLKKGRGMSPAQPPSPSSNSGQLPLKESFLGLYPPRVGGTGRDHFLYPHSPPSRDSLFTL